MTASALKPSSEDRDRAYRSRLKDEPLPAVIIDCASAVVLAANAGGLGALGLTPASRLPAALDSAMPAVAMLRDLQRRGLGATARHVLIFWRHGRTSTRLCDISGTDPSCGSHALVVFRPEEDTAQPTTPRVPQETVHPTFEAALAANDDCPPRVIRDDGETLKEIARRIREGQRQIIGESQDPKHDQTQEHFGDTVLDDNVLDDKEQAKAEPPVAPVQPDAEAASAPEAPAHGSPWDSHWDRPRDVRKATETLNTQQAQAEHHPSLAPDTPATPQRPSTHDLIRSLPPEDIAKLAHELKTPLSAIAAAAEIMRDERLGAMGNEKYLGYAADIHDSATHALAVIGEMLAAAPLTARRRGAGSGFDLTDLATRTVSSLQPLAAQRALTLTLDAEQSLLPVRANATAVRQILLNLLTNALKFTPPGGDVRVATGYLDDGAVYLVVRDTGEGITDGALEHAFDDATEQMTGRAGGGRGIGLRLVRRLTAENGAEFEIDTAPGRGTVVLVSFPKDLVGEV